MRHFTVKELVPPSVYQARGEASIELMDDRIIMGADWLRDLFGAITVNGMFGGKVFTESGLRDPFTTTGAKYSQHKFGRALDLKFHKTTPQAVYAFIMANQDEARKHGITTVEDIADTPTWLHISCQVHRGNGIRVVKP